MLSRLSQRQSGNCLRGRSGCRRWRAGLRSRRARRPAPAPRRSAGRSCPRLSTMGMLCQYMCRPESLTLGPDGKQPTGQSEGASFPGQMLLLEVDVMTGPHLQPPNPSEPPRRFGRPPLRREPPARSWSARCASTRRRRHQLPRHPATSADYQRARPARPRPRRGRPTRWRPPTASRAAPAQQMRVLTCMRTRAAC